MKETILALSIAIPLSLALGITIGMHIGMENNVTVQENITFQPNITNQVNYTKTVVNNTEYRYKATLERPWGAVPDSTTGSHATPLTYACDKIETGYGKSMRPMMWGKDKLCLEEINGDEVQRGMIIRYNNGGGSTIHMVDSVYPSSNTILTRGINNPNSYEYDKISFSQVTHIVTQIAIQ